MKNLFQFFPCVIVVVLVQIIPAYSLNVSLPRTFFQYNSYISPQSYGGYLYSAWVVGGPGTDFFRSFAVILDEQNEVVFFHEEFQKNQVLFTPLPHLNMVGITYSFYSDYFILLDRTFSPVDTILAPPGLILDGHELIDNIDGTLWYACWDDRQFDMSIYHPDAYEDALVRFHTVIQQDLEGNILWRWNSYDHVDELPMSDLVDTTQIFQSRLQHLHTNSIEFTPDGDVLISNRRMSEIVKIDYDTGDVLWRFGGGRGNQFDIQGNADVPLAFSQQHDIRILENGNLTVFDNGVDYDSTVSYAKEYSLDEENMTANLVWYYSSSPAIYGMQWGSTRRFENENTLIGWGGGGNARGASEVTIEGNLVREIELDLDEYTGGQPNSYRYCRSDQTIVSAVPYLCCFIRNDMICFYCNWFGHEEEVFAYNIYSISPDGINHLLQTTYTGILENYLVNPGGDYRFCIRAVDENGEEIGDFSNVVEIPSENEVNDFDISPIPVPARFSISSIYPNPFNSMVRISCTVPASDHSVNLSVYNIMGKVVYEFQPKTLTSGQYTLTWKPNRLSSGTYFVKLISGGHVESRRIELIR